MTKVIFLGARLEQDIVEMVEKTAHEEQVDKTRALKELIQLGRKQYLLKKYLDMYKDGKCSLDYAANKVGLTVGEIMEEAAKEGIDSSETIEEYKQGLQVLLQVKKRHDKCILR
ncbi:hypothetical protein HYY69_04525 [Candidatus Woesearchaeota archaeon]|nr:hypothetical protein [Candidatus Woesearchaeota archaeon]